MRSIRIGLFDRLAKKLGREPSLSIPRTASLLPALMGLKIVFFPDGVRSLWPDLLSVEPGEPPYRFRLNDTLYLKLVTPFLDPLYAVHMDIEC